MVVLAQKASLEDSIVDNIKNNIQLVIIEKKQKTLTVAINLKEAEMCRALVLNLIWIVWQCKPDIMDGITQIVWSLNTPMMKTDRVAGDGAICLGHGWCWSEVSCFESLRRECFMCATFLHLLDLPRCQVGCFIFQVPVISLAASEWFLQALGEIANSAFDPHCSAFGPHWADRRLLDWKQGPKGHVAANLMLVPGIDGWKLKHFPAWRPLTDAKDMCDHNRDLREARNIESQLQLVRSTVSCRAWIWGSQGFRILK